MAFPINDTLKQIVKGHLQTPQISVFLGGEPGIGKSSFVNGLREEGAVEVFSIDVNTLSDKGDLAAPRLVPRGDDWAHVFYPHATLVEANEFAIAHPEQIVIILLDEINRTESDVTSSALTLQTSRRAGHLVFAPNVRFMLTGNLSGNVVSLDSASLTRFAIYEVQADAATFLALMEDKHGGVHPIIKAVLEEHPDYIFLKPGESQAVTREDEDGNLTNADIFAESQDMVQYTAPRTIEGLHEWLTNTDPELITELVGNEVTDGPQGSGRTIKQLLLVLRGQTGDTAFTDEVYSKLLEQLSAPTTRRTLRKPTAWRPIEQTDERSVIDSVIGKLDDEAAEDVLLYALSTNNQPTKVQAVIDALTSRLGPISHRALTELVERKDTVNRASINYFYTKPGDLVASLESFKPLFDAN